MKCGNSLKRATLKGKHMKPDNPEKDKSENEAFSTDHLEKGHC